MNGMKRRPFIRACLALCLGLPLASQAAQVVSGDQLIEGNQCIGLDCVSSETFNGNTLTLKENNTRIRLWDSNVGGHAGGSGAPGSWSLEANDSANGGPSYMAIRMMTDSPRLSDGTAYEFDCSSNTPGVPALSGGAPILIPQGSPQMDHYCEPIFNQATVIRFNVAGDSGVVLGLDSASEAANVSLGNATTLRRLTHVAKALQDTDAVIKAQLDAGVYGDYKARLASLNQQLDTLDGQISQLEAATAQQPMPNKKGGGSMTPLLLMMLLGAGLIRLKSARV